MTDFVDPDHIQPLPEDNDPPAAPADQGQLNPQHQATDSAGDLDSHEVYDAGLASAAEASEPNADNAVVDYNPDNDQRKQAQIEDETL